MIGRPRPARVLWALGALALAAIVVGLAVGPVKLELGKIVRILCHAVLGYPAPDWRPWEEIVLVRVRLPRVLAGALVGGALATSGAALQGVFRNPMADPGLLGVSTGASLGAVLAIYLQWAGRSPIVVPAMAFVGALGATLQVYYLATRRGRATIPALVLAGVAVGVIASALTAFVLSIALPNYEIGKQIVYWLLGGLDSATWTEVQLAAPMILGGAVLLMLGARELNALAGGEDVAWSLGVDVPRVRRNLLILTSAITGAAVAISGSIAFVGLLTPHMLRWIVGPDHRALLPASFLGGAALLTLADLAARTLEAPQELRLGVLTSLVGGPMFLALFIVYKRRVDAW